MRFGTTRVHISVLKPVQNPTRAILEMPTEVRCASVLVVLVVVLVLVHVDAVLPIPDQSSTISALPNCLMEGTVDHFDLLSSAVVASASACRAQCMDSWINSNRGIRMFDGAAFNGEVWFRRGGQICGDGSSTVGVGEFVNDRIESFSLDPCYRVLMHKDCVEAPVVDCTTNDATVSADMTTAPSECGYAGTALDRVNQVSSVEIFFVNPGVEMCIQAHINNNVAVTQISTTPCQSYRFASSTGISGTCSLFAGAPKMTGFQHTPANKDVTGKLYCDQNFQDITAIDLPNLQGCVQEDRRWVASGANNVIAASLGACRALCQSDAACAVFGYAAGTCFKYGPSAPQAGTESFSGNFIGTKYCNTCPDNFDESDDCATCETGFSGELCTDTETPTGLPSSSPTTSPPTSAPSRSPSAAPTPVPTKAPSSSPTPTPSRSPSTTPSNAPSNSPTTSTPSTSPTLSPSQRPTPATATAVLLLTSVSVLGTVLFLGLAAGLLAYRSFRKGLGASAIRLGAGYRGFLSHYKAEAGQAARIVKMIMTDKLKDGAPFLDSDDLHDLAFIKEQLRESDAVIVLLTRHYLTRPYCIVELGEAHRLGLPIVPVQLVGIPDEFDYGELAASLDGDGFLDAAGWEVVTKQGVTRDHVRAALGRLSQVISMQFAPNASATVQSFQVDEIIRSLADEKDGKGANHAPVAVVVNASDDKF